MRVLFQFSSDPSIQHKSPWIVRQTTIKLVDKDLILQLKIPPAPIQPRSPLSSIFKSSLQQSPKPRTLSSKDKGSVKWATPAPHAIITDGSQDKSSSRIIDLCHTITHSKKSCTNLGCLSDASNKYRIHLVNEVSAVAIVSKPVSLGHVLSKSSETKLTRRERYLLALMVASSHLQLHESPWLGSQWRKQDILFPCSTDQKISSEKPYIARSFQSDDATMNGQSPRPAADHGLTTLGILLLELCFGVALEDHKIRKNFVTLDGQPNPGIYPST